MNTESLQHFFGDEPLTDPAKDELERKALAENLTKGLLKMASPRGYVVAVHGPWGTGKSTLLKFIRHYLAKLPEPDNPIIVEFNPWWFSGQEDLAVSFFNQLSSAIRGGHYEVEEIRHSIAQLAELVSHYPHWTTKMAAVIGKWLGQSEKSVPKVKAALAKKFKEHKKRIIVMIDDIDRLMPREIMEVFRLVKAVGDLPNILYVVAFDKTVVADAIKSVMGSEIPSYAGSYLEKIIQLPVELPIPGKMAVRKMFFRAAGPILTVASVKLSERDYSLDVYHEGIDHFLRTPRDVVRLTNALTLTFPMVEGEVNPVDFIALETLRIFRPLVYDQIRLFPEEFVGPTPTEKAEDVTKFHNSWMEKLEENLEGPAAKILLRVFPRFESAFTNIVHEFTTDWRSSLRACSPDKLPVYFALAVPTGAISRGELDHLASQSADARLFAEALCKLASQERPDGSSRAWQALEHLWDANASIIPQESIPCAVRGLVDAGDELIRVKDATGLLGIVTNRDRLTHLVLLLLGRLEPNERVVLVREVVEQAKGLSTLVEIITALGKEHGKYSNKPVPEEERLLRIDDMAVVEQEAGRRIGDAAEAGGLFKTPEFAEVIYGWKDWAGPALVSDWLQAQLREDANFLAFLRGLIPDDRIGSAKDEVSRLKAGGYLKRVRDFIKIEEYIDQMKRLTRQDDLSVQDRIRLMLLRNEGKPDEAT